VSRLLYSFEGIYKESRRPKKIIKNDVIELYFNLINFLLLTNIFPPNDNIDKYDIGNGKYNRMHINLRIGLIKGVLPEFLLKIDNVAFHHFIQDNFSLSEIKGILKMSPCQTWKKLFTNKKFKRNIIIDFIKSQNDNYIKIKFLKYCKNDTPSFLLKNVGLATEIFVLLFLLLQNYGYIIPLLLHQRIFRNFRDVFSSNTSSKDIKEKYIMTPTDFLLLSKGRIFALELGRDKPELISTLASISGIPTVYIDAKLNLGPKFGYKCNYCFVSFTICRKYIDLFKIGKIEKVTCSNCVYINNCRDKVYAYNLKNNDKIKKHIHCSCYEKMTSVQKELIYISLEPLPTYPIVTGLDKIELGL